MRNDTQSEEMPHNPDVGFIVHPTWRVRNGRTEILLYGRLRDGDTFLVVDARYRIGFFLRSSEEQRAREIVARFGGILHHSPQKTMDGEETVQVEVRIPGNVAVLRRALMTAGIRTYEADVPVAWAFLIDRGLRGAVTLNGTWQKGEHVDRVYHNPELAPCNWEPGLSVAYLALGVDPSDRSITAVALIATSADGQSTADDTFIIQSLKRIAAKTHAFPDECALLTTLRTRLCSLDPDLIVGWNVVDDLFAPLKERFAIHAIPFNLGRSNRLSRVVVASTSGRRYRGGTQVIIEGRQVLDARTIIRAGQRRFDDLRLATVAEAVLGRVPRSVNETAHAVLDVLSADDLVHLTIRRGLLLGIPLQRSWTSIQAFDFLYLSELHARGTVAPTRGVDRISGGSAPGGLILSPHPGVARNVLVFDFKSLYPSVIRTFNIDPVTLVPTLSDTQDLICAPNGATFIRCPGILPKILDRFFASREQAKARGDSVASYAYKIIMNSFYGVLGTEGCRFASNSISGAITSFGQHILRWTRDMFQDEGMTVIYGDTDSLFVDAGLGPETSPEEATRFGEEIAERVNARLTDYVHSTYGVSSCLELEMEKVYTRFFLPTVRGEARGRAKGYAGLLTIPGREELEVVGMEAIRRDWTPLARGFQRRLLDLAFHDASIATIEGYVTETLSLLRTGELDDLLIYQKTLRKPIEDYVKTQPPHVQAAALLPQVNSGVSGVGDVIRYVITVRGPRPVGYVYAPLDYPHYIRKQLLPIARSLVPLVVIDEALFGSGQMALF
jgi:DNA polymerase-2